MKRVLLVTLCFVSLLSCEKASLKTIGSETYTTYIYKGIDTKVELDDMCTVWTEGDLVSVFRSAENEKYRFDGKTGDVRGTLSKADESVPSEAYAKSYAVYPYSSTMSCTSGGVISYAFPAFQAYKSNSYALGSNTMVAVTQSAIDDKLSFRNVCGYIKLSIYGSSVCTLQNIKLYGNAGEKIAGPALIDANDLSVTMQAGANDVITLDFGDGISLQSESTEFWIALPPVKFTDGFTIELTTDKGKSKTQSTSKEIDIERNCVVPMKAMTPNDITSVEKVFVLYGDSITPQSVRKELQTLLDACPGESLGDDGFSVVRNHWKVVLAGVSGERPIQISARQGGVPVYLRGGFTIPAKAGESVEVGGLYSTWNEQAVIQEKPYTAVTFNWGTESTSSTYTGCSNPFLINGVECTYNGSTIKRLTDGEALTCDGETLGGEKWVRVYPYASWKYRDAYFSTYQGTNGSYNRTPAQGGNTYEVLSKFYDAETEYSTSGKHIIVGYHNPRWTLDCTNYFKGKYGVTYYDMKEVMLSRYEEIADILGIPLSESDIERLQGGALPLAWQSSSDMIHLTTPVGYSAYAVCVYLKMKELGYI